MLGPSKFCNLCSYMRKDLRLAYTKIQCLRVPDGHAKAVMYSVWKLTRIDGIVE
jgi:hypothetical protein